MHWQKYVASICIQIVIATKSNARLYPTVEWIIPDVPQSVTGIVEFVQIMEADRDSIHLEVGNN